MLLGLAPTAGQVLALLRLKRVYMAVDDLSPEQDYRVRVMGEEELELLRAAASQGGLQLGSLSYSQASQIMAL